MRCIWTCGKVCYKTWLGRHSCIGSGWNCRWGASYWWVFSCLAVILPATPIVSVCGLNLDSTFVVKLDALSIWNLLQVSVSLPLRTCLTNDITSLMGENQQPFHVRCYAYLEGHVLFLKACRCLLHLVAHDLLQKPVHSANNSSSTKKETPSSYFVILFHVVYCVLCQQWSS